VYWGLDWEWLSQDVQGPGSRVQGPGSRVQGPGSRVQGPGPCAGLTGAIIGMHSYFTLLRCITDYIALLHCRTGGIQAGVVCGGFE
jgi:hypothetical protein